MYPWTKTKWFKDASGSRLLENSLEGYDEEGTKVTLSIAIIEAEYIIHYKEANQDTDCPQYRLLKKFVMKYKKGSK